MHQLNECISLRIIIISISQAQERVSAGDAKVKNEKEEHIAPSVEEVPLSVMGDESTQGQFEPEQMSSHSIFFLRRRYNCGFST